MRILVLILLLTAVSLAESSEVLSRIGFGSCVHQDEPQPIWRGVASQKPDLFVLMGDNIYGDTIDMDVLAEKYEKQRSHPDFSKLWTLCPVLATWDDHDYCYNDAGRDFSKKEQSKKLFLSFLKEPPASPRWSRAGVYHSYYYGPPEQRLQILLLDTRWGRTSLRRISEGAARRLNKATGRGPYIPTSYRSAQLLHDDQWEWMKRELQKPAKLRLIVSSIPVLHRETGWETWDNFPKERERLFQLLKKTRAEGVVFLSGDSHLGQFARWDGVLPYPLWEVNSSGLTENARSLPSNPNRVGKVFPEDNFGMIKIDWKAKDPLLSLQIRGVKGTILEKHTLPLSEIQNR